MAFRLHALLKKKNLVFVSSYIFRNIQQVKDEQNTTAIRRYFTNMLLFVTNSIYM